MGHAFGEKKQKRVAHSSKELPTGNAFLDQHLFHRNCTANPQITYSTSEVSSTENCRFIRIWYGYDQLLQLLSWKTRTVSDKPVSELSLLVSLDYCQSSFAQKHHVFVRLDDLALHSGSLHRTRFASATSRPTPKYPPRPAASLVTDWETVVQHSTSEYLCSFKATYHWRWHDLPHHSLILIQSPGHQLATEPHVQPWAPLPRPLPLGSVNYVFVKGSAMQEGNPARFQS